MTNFTPFPKIPRLFRDIVITEKIDGTNAAVVIEKDADSENVTVSAQSRSRLITPQDDNCGFAAWVEKNKFELFNALGVGVHFGEWWGSGIQRGYGLQKGEKRFSLFNVSRWSDVDFSSVPGLGVVPTLYEGGLIDEHTGEIATRDVMTRLNRDGSVAAPGFMNPEGIIVFHKAANSMFKVTCRDDAIPKGLA